MLKYVLLGLAVAALLALLAFLAEKAAAWRQSPKKARATKTGGGDGKNFIVNCPLCGSHLGAGENLVSKVWRPMNVPEQRIVISGCPHCFPECEAGLRRSCPRCHQDVPRDGHLVAHLFNLPLDKKHVTVTGCTGCCKYEKPSGK